MNGSLRRKCGKFMSHILGTISEFDWMNCQTNF
jgi:hypothetical protein